MVCSVQSVHIPKKPKIKKLLLKILERHSSNMSNMTAALIIWLFVCFVQLSDVLPASSACTSSCHPATPWDQNRGKAKDKSDKRTIKYNQFNSTRIYIDWNLQGRIYITMFRGDDCRSEPSVRSVPRCATEPKSASTPCQAKRQRTTRTRKNKKKQKTKENLKQKTSA